MPGQLHGHTAVCILGIPKEVFFVAILLMGEALVQLVLLSNSEVWNNFVLEGRGWVDPKGGAAGKLSCGFSIV